MYIFCIKTKVNHDGSKRDDHHKRRNKFKSFTTLMNDFDKTRIHFFRFLMHTEKKSYIFKHTD